MDETYEKFWRDVYIAVVAHIGPNNAEKIADQALETFKQKFQRIQTLGPR